MIGCGFDFLGWETKNTTEVERLLREMDMVVENNWTPVIVEGDYQLIINLTSKLQNGT